VLEWRLVCISIARFMLAISVSSKAPALGQLKTYTTQGRAPALLRATRPRAIATGYSSMKVWCSADAYP